jgi:hypothetical protein
VTTPLVRERGFDLIAHRDDPPQRPRRWEIERRQFTGCEVSTTFIAVSVFTPWATAAAIDGNPSWDSAMVSPAVLTIRRRQPVSRGVLKAVTRIGYRLLVVVVRGRLARVQSSRASNPSAPPHAPDWRWRIVDAGGAILEESSTTFKSIAQAMVAGRERVQLRLDRERPAPARVPWHRRH